VLVFVNLQAAFLSPPVAMSAFYLKGVSPPHVTINQIFAGMMPYMLIVIVCMVLMYIWPGPDALAAATTCTAERKEPVASSGGGTGPRSVHPARRAGGMRLCTCPRSTGAAYDAARDRPQGDRA
jgi:hypothetical protein